MRAADTERRRENRIGDVDDWPFKELTAVLNDGPLRRGETVRPEPSCVDTRLDVLVAEFPNKLDPALEVERIALRVYCVPTGLLRPYMRRRSPWRVAFGLVRVQDSRVNLLSESFEHLLIRPQRLKPRKEQPRHGASLAPRRHLRDHVGKGSY